MSKTEKNTKRLSLRQELRAKAEEKIIDVTAEAAEAIHAVALKYGVKLSDLIKAIDEGANKTAEHNLVTQLANKAEVDLLKLWNDQQILELGEKND